MIRLQRVGRKHEPVFRLVLTDSKNSTKSGKFLEILGAYDSRKAEDAKFNNEKILHWMSKGAQISNTVHNLLLKRGVVQGPKRNVLFKRPVTKVEEKEEKTEPAPIVPEAKVASESIPPFNTPAEPTPEIVEKKRDIIHPYPSLTLREGTK